ncbi:MAG TPA: hypothetical protein P5137_08165, partial [Candidatus Brocadiia bacterium]|nr:hypothetical protein [Candidatus Brocadiia bacterium]
LQAAGPATRIKAPAKVETRDTQFRKRPRKEATAVYPLAGLDKRAFEWTFDLAAEGDGMYSACEIAIESQDGKTGVAVHVKREENTPHPYITLRSVGATGQLSAEWIPLPIERNTPLRLRLLCQPSQSVRLAIATPSGQPLWDTGAVPLYGPVEIERARFSIMSKEAPSIEWNTARDGLRLSGDTDQGKPLTLLVSNTAVRALAP